VVIGYIFPVLVFCIKKNLATMKPSQNQPPYRRNGNLGQMWHFILCQERNSNANISLFSLKKKTNWRNSQGDQMRLIKIAQNVGQPFFNFYYGKT
jgi:hypothetical protein